MGFTAVTAVAVGLGAQQQHQARKEQKRAAAAQSRLAGLERSREVRRQIRASRAARADILNTGAQTGVTGSSAVSGATSSVQTQLGSNVGFLGQTGVLQNRASSAQQKASDFFAKADLFNTVAGVTSRGIDFS